MNPIIYIEMRLHYKITYSENDIDYARIVLEGVMKPKKIRNSDIETYRVSIAKSAGVSVDKVEAITKEVYDSANLKDEDYTLGIKFELGQEPKINKKAY